MYQIVILSNPKARVLHRAKDQRSIALLNVSLENPLKFFCHSQKTTYTLRSAILAGRSLVTLSIRTTHRR